MKPEQDQLIRDLFGRGESAARRHHVLTAGGNLLRRRRVNRRIRQATLVATAVFLLATAAWFGSRRPPQSTAIVASAPAKGSARIQSLTDDELLALFPDTPVALAKIGDKEKLIFPRPGDAARFIKRIPANTGFDAAFPN